MLHPKMPKLHQEICDAGRRFNGLQKENIVNDAPIVDQESLTDLFKAKGSNFAQKLHERGFTEKPGRGKNVFFLRRNDGFVVAYPETRDGFSVVVGVETASGELIGNIRRFTPPTNAAEDMTGQIVAALKLVDDLSEM